MARCAPMDPVKPSLNGLSDMGLEIERARTTLAVLLPACLHSLTHNPPRSAEIHGRKACCAAKDATSTVIGFEFSVLMVV